MVMGQLRIQSPHDQFLGQLLEDAFGTDQVFRFFVIDQELIQQPACDGESRLSNGVSGLER
ncbi:hypothetical protein D3C85_1635090 [compost metagenome]